MVKHKITKYSFCILTDKRKIRDEHSIDTIPAFAAPIARGIESHRARHHEATKGCERKMQQQRLVSCSMHSFLGTLWLQVAGLL
jgi:hypothetical protein